MSLNLLFLRLPLDTHPMEAKEVEEKIYLWLHIRWTLAFIDIFSLITVWRYILWILVQKLFRICRGKPLTSRDAGVMTESTNQIKELMKFVQSQVGENYNFGTFTNDLEQRTLIFQWKVYCQAPSLSLSLYSLSLRESWH